MSIEQKNAPAGAPTPTGAENDTLTHEVRSNSMTSLPAEQAPATAQCSSCTVPATTTTLDPATGLCSFCQDPPPPLDADALLTEADHHLASDGADLGQLPVDDATVARLSKLVADAEAARDQDGITTLLASRLASASQCFPGPDGARVYVSSEGARITIAVTERDPETRQNITREFAATVTEVAR